MPGASVHRITLVTGDVAELTRLSDGRRSARLLGTARAPYYVGDFGGDLHLVPTAAYKLFADGNLDKRLFNLTDLVAQGYDDRSSDSLPLLLGSGTPKAQPVVPPVAKVRIALPSMAATAVTVAKAQTRQFWAAIGGKRLGAGKVWLDGRVRASLDRSVRQIGAPQAWRAGYDGRGVKVAVLDTGYDRKHPDLTRQVTGSRSFVPEETVQDGNGHGTHVASTVAGTGAGSQGRRKGVAPGARLLVGKVLDDEGSGQDSWVLAGMEWAVAQGAKVVSMSFGGLPSDGSDPLSQAVNRLSAKSGALFVIAAGNSGAEQTVSTPGSATAALTVGAVDDRDRLARFSSQGPRLGDGALKPEVTAPGVGIIAARAAGTNIGHDVSSLYTSLNGTSMATPHVAGAAAILAQRHPGWRAGQLKAALTTTARPSPRTVVPAQGVGRIDIPAALNPTLSTDRATLSFAAAKTQKVAYRNNSRWPTTLRLRIDVASPNGVRPALTISPTTLRIAPGSTGAATVALDPAWTSAGNYSGLLTARTLTTTVRTGIGFHHAGRLHRVTVNGITREGKPALAASGVQIWNTATGDVTAIAFDDAGRRTVEVPTGRYAVLGFVFSKDESDFDKSAALLGQPDVWVDSDRRFTFDARQTVPISISTPRRADPDNFIYAWHRKVGNRTALSGWYMNARLTPAVFVQRFSPVRHGSFNVMQRWDLAEPQLTVEATGPGGFRLPTPDQSGFQQRYVGSERIRLVDAGDGSPSEYAGARGAVALVRWRGHEQTAGQLDAAAEAGVRMVLLFRDQPGFWGDGIPAAMPVYQIGSAEGLRLRDLLRTRAVELQLTGIPDSTYRYDLMLSERRISGPLRYDVSRMRTASVTTAYHEHQGWQELKADQRQAYPAGIDTAFPITRLVIPAVTRTDYLTTTDVQWVDRTAAGEWNETGFEYSVPRTYRSGERVRRDWWAAIARPAVPAVVAGAEEDGLPVARFEDAIRVAIPQHVNGDRTVYGWSDDRADRTVLVLRRNGVEVGRANWSVAQFGVPAGAATYDLELDVRRSPRTWATTSTATHTVWRFRSGHVARRAVLPLLQVDYGLRTDANNAVPAAGGGWLTLRPGYQPGARGPGGVRVGVEVSWDEGRSWQRLRTGPGLAVRLPAATTGAKFGALRVTATDRAGNRMVQTIHRAFHLR